MFLWVFACQPSTTGHPPGPGADTTLEDLEVDGLDLSPAFSPDIRAYLVRTDGGAPVRVVATPTDPQAEVTVRLTTLAGETLETGDTLPLDVEQKVVVDVLSADGTTSTSTTVIVVPPDFPEITTTGAAPVSPGWVFLATLPEPWLLVLDPNGVPDWYASVPNPSYDFRRSVSGGTTLVAVGDPTVAVVRDPSFSEIARWTPPTLAGGISPVLDVHELFELADGGVLMVGLYAEPRDLSPWGGPVDGKIAHTVVQEAGPDGALRFAWTTDGAIDLDAVPLWVYEPAVDGWDYAHVNSVSYDPDDGNLVISIRLASQVLKVARVATVLRERRFHPGQVMWRLGGRDGNVVFVDDVRPDGWRGFWGQHSVRPLAGGHLIVFDNAIRREAQGATFQDQDIALTPTGGTRFVEYALDLDRMTATRVTEHPSREPAFTQAGGSVQRLDDGHTLIGWGDLPMAVGGPSVTELDPDGGVVWELTLPPGLWSYRAWRAE